MIDRNSQYLLAILVLI